MTTIDRVRGIHIGPEGNPSLTLGWEILQWTADWLLQPDGVKAGDPWEFTDEQARFLLWWYAIDERGQFVYRRGMLRRMKGWGKDPFAAALCAVEFVGPCRLDRFEHGQPIAKPVHSAWVQTAAVSKDQTRNTMTLFPGMFSPAAIAEYGIDLGKEIIYAHRGRCRIEAVTSSPRALEGGRATFVLKNETHHWLQSNEGLEMAKVIMRNSAKINGRVLAISNAHNPGEQSDAEHDYEAHQAIESGRSRATGFLYDSVEAPPETILRPENEEPETVSDARRSLAEGLKAAAGDSWWVPIDNLIETIYDPGTSPSEARRFYLNQIVAAEDAWITQQEWDKLAAPKVIVEPKEIITMGFDGSKGGDARRSYDHTVLMGCRVGDSHLFPIGVWDPAQFSDNLIPTSDVDAKVRHAFEAYDVVGFYADVNEWETLTSTWEQDLGETLCALSTVLHPVKWDMRGSRAAALAAEAYHDAIVDGDLTHSNDPAINQYHYNARRRIYNAGATAIVTFGKESMFSSRKVDGAAAAMLARKARQDYLALPADKQRRKDAVVGFSWL